MVAMLEGFLPSQGSNIGGSGLGLRVNLAFAGS